MILKKIIELYLNVIMLVRLLYMVVIKRMEKIVLIF